MGETYEQNGVHVEDLQGALKSANWRKDEVQKSNGGSFLTIIDREFRKQKGEKRKSLSRKTRA